jgi:acyl dehydratase
VPVTHEVDAEWVAGFAAGVGDPTDRHVAHPLFPVCVEWPAVTAAARLDDGELLPDERRRGIHATHDLTIHRPLSPGDVLTTTATIDALEPHSRGTRERLRLETRDTTGAVVATTIMGSLFLGVAIEGAPLEPDTHTAATARDDAGESHPAPVATAEIAVRADQARLYSEGSRIWNPIHTDAGAAAAAGLPAPILHGTCTLAMATSAALALAGVADASELRRIRARFAGMVLMPSSLELRMTQGAERELLFEVFDPQGAAVIRDGHLTL